MYKPRLRRLDRLFTPNPIYFVTSCTRQRDSLLDNMRYVKPLSLFPSVRVKEEAMSVGIRSFLILSISSWRSLRGAIAVDEVIEKQPVEDAAPTPYCCATLAKGFL